MEALTRAEGLSPEAGNELLVTVPKRAADGTVTSLVRRISVKALMDASDPELNLRLYGGEEISIPEVGRVYVAGNVHKPGTFALKDSSGMTLMKLLAMAEGLTQFSSRDAYIYRREGKSNGKNEITVPLQKIMDRKSPDVTLQADDIVYVPDNKGRRLTVTALEKIVGFGSTTASGVLVWGH
jgi:polysaccharide export outer membrane protein